MLLLKYLKFSLLINFKNLSEQEEDSILDQMDTLWYASNKLELLIIRYFTKSIYNCKIFSKSGKII